MLTTQSERWHEETSSFHLHIPIEGIMLSHDKKVTRDNKVQLMIELLGVSEVLAVKELLVLI